jgi:hypothetical protein
VWIDSFYELGASLFPSEISVRTIITLLDRAIIITITDNREYYHIPNQHNFTVGIGIKGPDAVRSKSFKFPLAVEIRSGLELM